MFKYMKYIYENFYNNRIDKTDMLSNISGAQIEWLHGSPIDYCILGIINMYCISNSVHYMRCITNNV